MRYSHDLMTVGIPAPGYRITGTFVDTELNPISLLEPMVQQVLFTDTEG